MAPHKYVIKCGNFAVLVDLHVLPQGGRPADPSWFTTDQVEEVTTLVRDAVDQRVKQYTESLHNRRVPKHKKELTPASAFYVTGDGFNLAANFLKRHCNLRCIAKQLSGDLRMFPERFVVCVSCPEDASALRGNLSHPCVDFECGGRVAWEKAEFLNVKELSEQSRSEYFSKAAETKSLLTSPQNKENWASKDSQTGQCPEGDTEGPPDITANTGLEEAHSNHSSDPVVQIGNNLEPGPSREENNRNPDKQTASRQEETLPETRETTRDEGEDPIPQPAKRACLENSLKRPSTTPMSRQNPRLSRCRSASKPQWK
ncbi:hypothetical protein WMY93_018743 [Mugilogobius chulae]|uniref:Protein SLX4IP n=1 Tax=Mugilogobius chulae TaxID=88201 RepID=A0AAW0NX05_9GOBI